jgi:hypothetical protein
MICEMNMPKLNYLPKLLRSDGISTTSLSGEESMSDDPLGIDGRVYLPA